MPAFLNPDIMALYSAVFWKYSSVIISEFLVSASGTLHEGTGFPSNRTVHEPQKPSAQPDFTERHPWLRSICISGVSGLSSKVTFSELSVN